MQQKAEKDENERFSLVLRCVTVFAGATYAVADLHRRLRHQHPWSSGALLSATRTVRALNWCGTFFSMSWSDAVRQRFLEVSVFLSVHPLR